MFSLQFKWYIKFKISNIIFELFLLTAKGTANPIHAGLISSLAEDAKKLDPNMTPVICLESDAW